MKRIILLMTILSCTQILMSQSKVFEKQAALIAQRIDSITTSEKNTLKKELKKIDKKLEKREISFEEAEAKKKKIADYHAKRINDAVFKEEQRLQKLIKDRVSGTLQSDDEETDRRNNFFTVFSEENYYKDSITGLKVEKRWTTQFVIALGLHKVLNDDSGFYGEGFRVNPVGYGEIGFSFKYRLKENTNLWNLKLGLSTMINELRPDRDNDILITDQNQTTLQDAGFDIKRSRFNNVYIGMPVHLELDFSKPKYNEKTKETHLRSQRGFRLGLGGFFAVRVATTQFIRYNDEDGKRIRLFQQDNFNVNNVNFGPSAYIGYRDISLYFKYDANPIFRNNPADINNLSLALRFDFN